MQFDRVLVTLSDFFQREQIRYAIAGGFALHAWGHSRLTLDLDFLVEDCAHEKVVAFMESLGYETLYVSNGYSNHLHADSSLGRVDFIYVDEATAAKVFSMCEKRLLLNAVQIPAPRPEHLAAMKVLAMKNDPSRTFTDMADVQFLISLPGVNREEIREYFARHGLLSKFDELS